MIKIIRNFYNIIKEAFNFSVFSLLSQKLRTSLSLIGVVLGIFSIVIVLSLIDSLKKNIEKDIEQIGKDVVFVKKMSFFDIKTEADYFKQKSRPVIKLSETEKLKNLSKEIDAISFVAATENIEIKGNKIPIENTVIMGVSQEYIKTSVLNIEEGRYFTEIEQLHGSDIAIISKEISDLMYPIRGALNQNIFIKGRSFRVIGILKATEQSVFNQNGGSMVFLPSKAFGKIFRLDSDRHDASLIVKPKDGVSLTQLQEEIDVRLRALRKLKPYQNSNFSTISSDMISDMMGQIFDIMNSVGFVIGFFSLLVGAFGISNIMSVSVKERTAEIGIQKALGARNIYILTQFLFESILLCFIGGIISLALIFGIFEILNKYIELPLTLVLSNTYLFLGVVLSIVVGVLSGVIPAYKASKMHPVEAISVG